MKNIFDIKTESGLTAALETYCDKNGLPFACANELLADCHGHVAWLSEFIRQWDKVQGANDRLLQALEDEGFEREIGGGGCVILSRYLANEAYIWITCIDGGGLPESDNWMICTYGNCGDILYEASSESDITFQQAINKALLVADTFWSSDTFWLENSLCRNGKPIADCDCC